MITVAILVNGKPLIARAAVNRNEKNDAGETKYETDAGDIVWHAAGAGAVALGQKLLATIKEPGVTLGKDGIVHVPKRPRIVTP